LKTGLTQSWLRTGIKGKTMTKRNAIVKKVRPELETEDSTALSISTSSGEPGITFPEDVVESLRYMVNRVENKASLPNKISMVSALRGEGVTYLSMALGALIANDIRANVCVVDLNWWWPTSIPLVPPSHPGLAEVLTGDGKVSLKDVLVKTSLPRLSLAPAGVLPRASRPVISHSQALNELVGELSRQFDHLVLDIPAILTTNDAVPLASLGDACCLVLRQRVTGIEDVRNGLDEIAHLKILGVVMNRVKYATPSSLLKWVAAR
jgi:Mrp family chromosome partitioning ATPase